MRKILAFLLAATAVIGVVGCDDTDDVLGGDNPNIQLFNALRTDTNIRATADGEPIGNAARGEVSAETEVGAGNTDLRIISQVTGNVLHQSERLLETNTNYVLVAFHSLQDPDDGVVAKLVRTNEDTTAGMAEVSMVRATNVYGNMEVWVVPNGTTTKDGVQFDLNDTGEDNVLHTVVPGVKDVRVYEAGTNNLLFVEEDINMEANHNYMLIVSARGNNTPFEGEVYSFRER